MSGELTARVAAYNGRLLPPLQPASSAGGLCPGHGPCEPFTEDSLHLPPCGLRRQGVPLRSTCRAQNSRRYKFSASTYSYNQVLPSNSIN